MSATHRAPHIGLRGRYAFANLITNFHISTIIPEINLKLTDVSGFQSWMRRKLRSDIRQWAAFRKPQYVTARQLMEYFRKAIIMP